MIVKHATFSHFTQTKMLSLNTFNPSSADSYSSLSFCSFHPLLQPLNVQTSAVIAVNVHNQLAQRAGLLSMTSEVSHAHLTIYQLPFARITLTGAKNAALLVKTAFMRQS